MFEDDWMRDAGNFRRIPQVAALMDEQVAHKRNFGGMSGLYVALEHVIAARATQNVALKGIS